MTLAEYEEEVILNGLGGIGVIINTCKKNKYIRFEVGPELFNALTAPLKTDNGMTVGERNRENLHKRLDDLLDNNL